MATERRERKRKPLAGIDKEKIAQRVIDFYEADNQNRSQDIENRLQRYAKYRLWKEGKSLPWEGCSDIALPDMMTHSMKVQDTLHNAVMSTRPSVIAKALQESGRGKEDAVNSLLDYQFFVENKGELIVGEMAEAFVNDGLMTVYLPWVKEEREVHQIFTLPPLPDGVPAETYFDDFLRGTYGKMLFRKASADGWSWEVQDNDEATEWFKVEFYSTDDGIEVDELREVEVFNAPRPIVKDYEDVLAPVRCANLQIPSPSNPGGATHVIIVDYPTIDEINRLRDSGYYDFPAEKDEAEVMERTQDDKNTWQEEKTQKDTFQGANAPWPANTEQDTPGHKTVTRLICFDIYDVDGDGKAEDVIWWVIKETKTLLRVRELTQVYPANPPRRPFAEAAFLPVRGRRGGISLLEQMEGLHDAIKQFADQTVDGGTMSMSPWGLYRASGNMRPEVIRMAPFELYPVSDPKNDINFPQMPSQGSALGLNLVTMFGQMQERLTNIGDLQLGRVPQGKASALRTKSGMQTVMGQGESRPERILRRFFMCFSEVFSQMHELNQVFLPREKMYRVNGVKKPNDDPYRKIMDPSEIRGRFTFDFTANAMNTSKEALQESLQGLMTAYVNPLSLQLGTLQADGFYQLQRDYGRAMGQDPDKYLTPPSPDSGLPKMFGSEVLNAIMAGNTPQCRPEEPSAQMHMDAILMHKDDVLSHFTPDQMDMLSNYITQLQQRILGEARQQAMQAAAAQFQAGQQGGGTPGPQAGPTNTTPAPHQPGKVQDMSLPSAGGGANQTSLQ